MWTNLGLILLSLFFIWMLIGYIRKEKKAFSAKKLNDSFFTMGILALILIGFIALCVYFLNKI